ncbi:MAG: hypothetical protein WBC40_10405 [Halobacteriota archaeon]
MKWRFFALFATLAFILVFVSSIDVVTLFHGSHNLIDISYPGNDINCTWCHQWVQDNLSSSAEGIHADFRCEDCHRIKDTEIVFASHGKSGEQAHAAYTPRCLDCHGGSGKQIESKFAPPAPAFNESTPLYGSDVSAHKPLVNWSLDYNLSVGENEACLACHTNYSIKNVFKRPEYFDFTIDSNMVTGWFVQTVTYGDTNTTNISKAESGAKHEFKALNQINCTDCHSDVWQAANHTESRFPYKPDFSTKASHVCWKWDKNGKEGNDPMHNVSYVEVPGGYDNITEYCLLSCHKPTVKTGDPPVNLTATVHAARRLSCYHCHNDEYSFSVLNKPGTDETPDFGESKKHEGLDTNVLSEPLFLHAETCIACKRAGAPSPGMQGQDFQTYTEPNNTMYWDSTPI